MNVTCRRSKAAKATVSLMQNVLFKNAVLLLTLLVGLLYTPAQTIAQSAGITVSGTIKDEDGKLLNGASVSVKSSGKATSSDAQGRYKLVAPNANATLVFSCVGFESQEIALAGKLVVNVSLKPSLSSLDDIIVVGYGTTKRKDLVGSVGKADIADMKKAPVPSFDQMLAGRIAGVSVAPVDGQPGGGSSITIRGSSVSQETSPLFVIDGFPVENMDLNSINPNDIESFEVLKDPSSIAIYGSRGGNGVILITTKKGKVGVPKLAYNFSLGIQRDIKRIKMMNPYEFVKLQLELDSLAGTPGSPSNRFRQVYLDPTEGIDLDYYKTQQGYDWQDLMLQTGIVQIHSLSLSGGTADTRYSLSGGYYNQKGIIINTGMKRYDGRFSLDQRLGKSLRTGVSASYSNSNNFGTIAAAGNSGGVVQGMWQYRPTNGAGNQDLANNLIDSTALEDFFSGNSTTTLGDNLINPLKQAQNEFRKTTTNTALVNLYLEYSFLKKFKLRLSGGYTSTALTLENFYNSQTQQGNLFKNAAGAIPNTNGINGGIYSSLAQTFSTSNTITYSTSIKQKHNIDGLAGVEYQYAKQVSTTTRAINIPQATEYLGLMSLGTGTPAQAYRAGTRNRLASAFARMNYNYASKYYLSLAIRSDGSSRFAPGNQWGYFPSGGAAWTFSQENFMKRLKPVISYAKLRVSYGSTGNNKVGDFSYMSQFGSIANNTGYAWNNVNIGGITPFFYGNSALTWEKTTGFDYGLNLELLKGRFTVDAVYYRKKTTDFLLGVRLPFSAGYPNSANSQYQNTGEVSNNGFELTLTSVNVKKKDFMWTSNFNISFNRSRIDKFYNGLESIQTAWNLTGNANAWISKQGGPLSQFYGFLWGGVYQFSDFDQLPNGTYQVKPGIPVYTGNVRPGDPKYIDLNGDGVVDANDRTTLGTPLPTHTGGVSNNFTYKNWSLNVFFQWSAGNRVLNANRVVFESTGGYNLNGNQFASYANRWTPDNPTNDIPAARYNLKGDAGSSSPRISSRVVEDASFLRLKTISLGYDLPASLIKKMKIANLRFNISAQNIWTLTKYSGIDPEVNTFRTTNPANSPFGGAAVGNSTGAGAGYTFIQPSSGYAALAGGYDYTPYPRAFVLTFGLNANF